MASDSDGVERLTVLSGHEAPGAELMACAPCSRSSRRISSRMVGRHCSAAMPSLPAEASSADFIIRRGDRC